MLPGETSTLGYVRALAADDVRALGEHAWILEDETSADPPFEYFFLRWDGHRWQRAAYPPRAAHSAVIQPVAPGGSGGLVLGAWLRRTPTGRYRGIDAPPRVEGWTDTGVEPKRRQWLALPDLALAPGTHTLFGAGAPQGPPHPRCLPGHGDHGVAREPSQGDAGQGGRRIGGRKGGHARLGGGSENSCAPDVENVRAAPSQGHERPRTCRSATPTKERPPWKRPRSPRS